MSVESHPIDKEVGIDAHSVGGMDHTRYMSKEEREVAEAAARFGYGPLVPGGGRLSHALGDYNSGMYRIPAPQPRKFGNPLPLGLCGFALTTFVLSLINLQTRGVTAPNLVVASAYGYGGLVQLLASMWAMASGETFAATAMGSFGGFWITFGIIETPGGFQIAESILAANGGSGLDYSLGFWLMGWFIFCSILVFCTLKTSLVNFLLFFTLDIALLLLSIGRFLEEAPGVPNAKLIKAGGLFGLLAAFLAWYVALHILADQDASWIHFPVFNFPWSTAAQAAKRQKTDRDTV